MSPKLSVLVISLLTLTASSAGYAGTAVNEGVGAAKPATTATPTIPVSTSINPNAGAGKQSQSGGSAANMAAAAMLMAACMATQPPNMALCMMGAMAAMQGGHDKDAAGQSGATQMASAVTGSTTTNTSAAPEAPNYQGDAKATASVKDQKAIAAGMAKLAEAGFTATPTGIKSSGGTIPAASFSSSGAMAAAGIDPAQAKEAIKVAEKVSNDVSRYAKMGAVAEGTGGGSPGSDYSNTSAPADDGAIKPAAFGNPFAINDKARGDMMAGKTVNFDGERIGVRGDNIFDMVHSAYQRKTAGKHFIETDNDPELNSRVPAGAGAPGTRAPVKK